jgi:methanogenic corrinoid protein MtbC1
MNELNDSKALNYSNSSGLRLEFSTVPPDNVAGQVMSKHNETEALWSSADVAAAFGVGVSSIKRWTDQGHLESVKTIGGHRRYRLEAIYSFARDQNLRTDLLPPLELDIDPESTTDTEMVDSLLAELDAGNVESAGRMVSGYLGRVADPTGFLDRVIGELLQRIGTLWAEGKWTVEKEHRSAYCIAEAIDRTRRPEPVDGEIALLACPPGELHALPLHMIRHVLSANGWRTDFLGADVPWDSIDAAVARMRPSLVLLSARSEVPFNAPEFTRLASAWRETGAIACVGGGWARGGARKADDLRRFRTLAGFERWLRSDRT